MVENWPSLQSCQTPGTQARPTVMSSVSLSLGLCTLERLPSMLRGKLILIYTRLGRDKNTTRLKVKFPKDQPRDQSTACGLARSLEYLSHAEVRMISREPVIISRGGS